MLLEVRKIPNGDIFYRFEVYECDRCNTQIDESMPHTHKGNIEHYCWDCSFILSHISESEYLKNCGICLMNIKAEVIDGKIVITQGKRPSERTNSDERNSSRYRNWRKKVFERDNFTCQHCGQRGGELNAHHVKPFAKYKKLRFEVDNGLTLCVSCHRNVHKKTG